MIGSCSFSKRSLLISKSHFIVKLSYWKLFRKSINGDSYNEFHRLCDNQGKTITLIQTKDGLIKYYPGETYQEKIGTTLYAIWEKA